MIRCIGLVSGRVQGVWFRRFVQMAARAEAVQGYAKNLVDGRVEVLLEGESEAVNRVQRQVAAGPPGARVDRVEWQTVAADGRTAVGFQVL